MEEDGAHAGGDAAHHTNLSAQAGVLVTLLDEHLYVGAVPVLAAQDVVRPQPRRRVVRRLRRPGRHRGVADTCSIGDKNKIFFYVKIFRYLARAPRSWARVTAGRSCRLQGRGWVPSWWGRGCWVLRYGDGDGWYGL